ncbi:clostripain-related cysteine peptidase [Nocardioides sp.]|uniref:clostripain-related cysteine peptidase n=1 Tax=Nocardioides sp. TaxID=35761 RepID=UPI00351872D5
MLASLRPRNPARSRSRRLRSAAAASMLPAALLSACTASEDDGTPDPRAGEGWTVLHYSMADTDLEPFMVDDLNEMGEVGTQGGLQLRAFMDRSKEYGKAKALDQGNWVGARVLDVLPDRKSELVDDLGDVDSADPAVLADFIAQGIADRPAQKYALIISDHGASWPGIGPDEGADDNVLDLAEMTRGIRDGLKRAGLDRLDLLGFDACLMASYEVASAMAPLAKRLIASQELEPGHGWDYTVLQQAADDPDISADDLGSAILDGFKEQAKEEDTQESITLALLDLDRMKEVDEAVDALADALGERAAKVSGPVGRVAQKTLSFARSPDETEDAHLLDLGLLAGGIAVEALDVADEADAVVRAVNDVTLAKVDGKATKGASGLSIYFPPNSELIDDAYTKVRTAKGWNGFLDAYYGAGDALTDEESASLDDGATEVEFDGDGYLISSIYDEIGQDNLVGATIAYALKDADGSLRYIGEEFAEIGEDGEPVAAGFYDQTQLVISDGEDEAVAYLQLERAEDDGQYTVNVPMAYYAPDDVDGETYQDALLSLVFDEEGDIISEVYYAYDADAETYGELTVEPDGIIVPEILTVDAQGEEEWVATTETGLYADLDNLTYDLQPVEKRTPMRLELTVTDVGGNTSTVGRDIRVR